MKLRRMRRHGAAREPGPGRSGACTVAVYRRGRIGRLGRLGLLGWFGLLALQAAAEEGSDVPPDLSRLTDTTLIFAAAAATGAPADGGSAAAAVAEARTGGAGTAGAGTATATRPDPGAPGATVADPPPAPCVFCAGYWTLLKHDVEHEFTSPARWDRRNWRSVGVKSLVVVGAMALADRRVASYLDRHKSATTDRVASDFEPFGREYAAYVVGGFLVAGDLARDENAKAVAVDGLSTTLIAAGLVTPALKLVTGRSRPRAGKGAHDFHPLSGGESFPSGHTTAAFSVAATVAEHYRALWVKGLAYGLASTVAYARMEKDAHFLSDVTAGAMIGVGVAHSVYRFNRSRRRSVAVRPLGAPSGPGAEVSVEFALR